MQMQAEATYTENGQPQSFSASVHFDTRHKAAELAGWFPKSLRIRTGECSSATGTTYTVRFSAALAANGTTGEVNETSQKRIRSFCRHAERLGVELHWRGDLYGNSYPTRAEFDQAAL